LRSPEGGIRKWVLEIDKLGFEWEKKRCFAPGRGSFVKKQKNPKILRGDPGPPCRKM